MKINKILIIEDSKFFNNQLKRALQDMVKDIKQIYTFHEAECILEDEDFDYVFLDLILPDGEGDELVESLSSKVRNKTIVLTGDEDVERRDHLFKLGILEYFSKKNPLNLIINDIKNLLISLEENKNYNVLVVDDSSFIRKTMKNVLKPRKYNLFFAKNGAEAKEILEEHTMSLMFLDIELPDISGVELLEEIKSDDRFLNLPVISISNNDNPVIVARLLKHGAKDFIKKPFVAEYLVLKCDMHIKSYRNVILLEKQTKELNKLNKMKSEFFSSVSHEIRTPLNSINGFIKMLTSMKLPQEAKKYVNFLDKTTDDLIEIINDFLDFEKIENNKLEIEKIEFNLKDELEVIKEIFTQNTKSKGIDFKTNFENIDKLIISDKTRIKQVITNLLSNAIKFTPEGKKILFTAKLENEILFISVEDEGIGIEKDKIQTILEPFSQADKSTSRKFGGTGLGLSIVKKIIDLLHGELKIESEVGKGSKFIVKIPVKIVVNKKLNILVAEDNNANQLFIEAILKKLGHNYKIVNNGKEALEVLQKDKFDVVMLDNEMPIMNGDDALKEIKKL